MKKYLRRVFLAVLLVFCLLGSGCSRPDVNKIQSWKELIRLPSGKDEAVPEKQINPTPGDSGLAESDKTINVQLYFGDSKGQSLVAEDRSLAKVEGIARKTVEELLKGPSRADCITIFPPGTRLLDINIKPEGLCIVDFSSELLQVDSNQQGKLMVYSIVNTLGQFPTIKEVSFLINGKKLDSINGAIDVSNPIQANYSI